MLLIASLALVALSPAVSGLTYGLGKSFLIGSGSTSSISKVSTTLNPGAPPENQIGQLKLYPAMSNGMSAVVGVSNCAKLSILSFRDWGLPYVVY